MPELSDVEGFKRYVSRYAEGKRIRRIRVSDARVLRNTSAPGLGRALARRRVGHPERRGKWLVIPVSGLRQAARDQQIRRTYGVLVPSVPELIDDFELKTEVLHIPYSCLAFRVEGGRFFGAAAECCVLTKSPGILRPSGLCTRTRSIRRLEFGPTSC